jgi:DnaJ-class molecular chaperone
MTDLFYAALNATIDDAEKASPVKPVIVQQCWLCRGSGWASDNDGNLTGSCTQCAGRGMIASDGGEA